MKRASPRLRRGISTFTSPGPISRKPCVVSSLVSRSSTRLPSSTTTSAGVNENRSATIRTTRSGAGSWWPLSGTTHAKAREPARDAMHRRNDVRGPSEPPSETDVDGARRRNRVALVAHVRVVELDGDVRIDPVGRADDPGVAVELRKLRETRRHAVLRVEVLVPHEHRGVVRKPGRAARDTPLRGTRPEAARRRSD